MYLKTFCTASSLAHIHAGVLLVKCLVDLDVELIDVQEFNSLGVVCVVQVIDLTQLIKGTQCLVDEIQQSHSRGLGLLKCRIDRLEVSHRSFVENWENSMRKIVTEHFKSHETQYRYLESRVMTGLTKGLKEFQSARSSMENSRACFQG